jgi:hypothetical protein
MSSISGVSGYNPYSGSSPLSSATTAAANGEGLLFGEAPSVLASNAGYLFSQLNQSILYTGTTSGVGSAIDTYTQSLASSNVYDDAATAPSDKFLSDLATIKADASKGDLAGAAQALQAGKYDSPDNVAGAFSSAYDRGDVAAETSLTVEAAANTSDNLIAEGYSALDAERASIAFTINSRVDHSNNTASTAQTQGNEISDLATSLVSTNSVSNNPKTTQTAGDPLFDILYKLIESTASSSDPDKAYAANNQALAALDSAYGSNGVATSGVSALTPFSQHA